VAGGLSIGIFFAMLPIPFQMLFSAVACMRAKVNVPVAMATCWISNPFTHPPLILVQLSFGNWIRKYILLSLLAYPIVYGISAFLPNRGKRLKAIKQRRSDRHL